MTIKLTIPLDTLKPHNCWFLTYCNISPYSWHFSGVSFTSFYLPYFLISLLLFSLIHELFRSVLLAYKYLKTFRYHASNFYLILLESEDTLYDWYSLKCIMTCLVSKNILVHTQWDFEEIHILLVVCSRRLLIR